MKKIRNDGLNYIENLMKGAKKNKYSYYDESAAINFYTQVYGVKSNEKAPERLKNILFSLLEIENFFDIERSSVKLFKYLMTNAASDDETLRNESLDNMVKCLAKSPKFYSIWKEIYVKNLAVSNNLLSHLHENWSAMSKIVSAERLGGLIGDLISINDDLAQGRYVDPTSKKTKTMNSASEKKQLAVCTQSVNALQKKLRGYVKDSPARRGGAESGGRGIFGSLVMGAIAASVAGAYYLNEHCCELAWCKSNPYVGNQLGKFFGC